MDVQYTVYLSLFKVMEHADWLLRGLEKAYCPPKHCERAIYAFFGLVSFGGEISELI